MMLVNVERRDGVPVVRPREDVDAANAVALREQLTECVDSGTDRLVVDLTETRYVDSAGIDMLFRLGELLRQRRAMLLLVIAADSNLARLAEIVGLAAAMPLFPTVQEALGAPAGRALRR
jgi:anti-sigma B factor antagonist